MIFESDLAPEALRELILANASRDFRERKPFFLHSELDGVLEITVRTLALGMRQAQARLRILPANRGSVLEVEVVGRRRDGWLLGATVAVLLLILVGTARLLEPASRLFLIVPAIPLAYYPWALARRYQVGPTQLLAAMARLAAGQIPERTGAPWGQRALLALAALPFVLVLGGGLALAPLALLWPPFPPGDGRALLADGPAHEHVALDLRQHQDPLVAYALVDKLLPCGYPCTYYALEGQAKVLKQLDPAAMAPAAAERLLAARTRAAEARPSLQEVVRGLGRSYLAGTLRDLGPAGARQAVRKRAADLAIGPISIRQAYLEAGDLQGLRQAGLDRARPAEWFGIVTGMEAAGAAAVLGLVGLEAGEPTARHAAVSTFHGIEISGPEDVVRYQTFVAREAALMHLLRRRTGRPDVPAMDPFAPGRPLRFAGGEGWSVGIDGKDDGGKPYALAGHPRRHWESGSGASCWNGLEGDLPLLHGGRLAL